MKKVYYIIIIVVTLLVIKGAFSAFDSILNSVNSTQQQQIIESIK